MPTATRAKEEQTKIEARRVNLTYAQLRVLRALAKHGDRDGLTFTYRQIESFTGYYSILTAIMRDGYPNSLGSKRLIREKTYEINGRQVLHFAITAAGRKLLKKTGAKS